MADESDFTVGDIVYDHKWPSKIKEKFSNTATVSWYGCGGKRSTALSRLTAIHANDTLIPSDRRQRYDRNQALIEAKMEMRDLGLSWGSIGGRARDLRAIEAVRHLDGAEEGELAAVPQRQPPQEPVQREPEVPVELPQEPIVPVVPEEPQHHRGARGRSTPRVNRANNSTPAPSPRRSTPATPRSSPRLARQRPATPSTPPASPSGAGPSTAASPLVETPKRTIKRQLPLRSAPAPKRVKEDTREVQEDEKEDKEVKEDGSVWSSVKNFFRKFF